MFTSYHLSDFCVRTIYICLDNVYVIKVFKIFVLEKLIKTAVDLIDSVWLSVSCSILVQFIYQLFKTKDVT